MHIDARIPVAFTTLDQAGPDDAVLIEADGLPPRRHGVAFRPAPGNVTAGCSCCAPRGPLARALNDMFVARAKGASPFFRRVVAVAESEAGRGAMFAALTEDPVCSARFRLE